MRRALATSALLAAAIGTPAAASPLAPDDFALGIPIEHDPGLPYFTVELPEIVYRSSVDPALRDVRFFDADGRQLDHELVTTNAVDDAAGAASPPPATVDLPLFAVLRGGASTALETRIRISDDGTLVTLNQAAAPVAAQTQAWLIDASTVTRQAARFVVEAAPGHDVFVSYAVDGSHDLERWTTLVARGALVRFEQDGHVLHRAGFSIAPQRYPYLRLRWHEPALAPPLAHVRAELRAAARAENLVQLRLAATPVAGASHEFRFDSGGHFPVREAALVLEPNRVVRGRLETGDGQDDGWTTVAVGEWYALRVDDNVMRSAPRPVSDQGARYWRLVADSGYAPLDARPELELYYAPLRYRVLAAGRPPYVLASGSGRAAQQGAYAPDDPRTAPVALPDAARLSAPASLGPAFELGGDSRREAPAAVLPWQRIALWAVLGAGVLLLGAMVLRLYRGLGVDTRQDRP